jgi:HEAT repeat protein
MAKGKGIKAALEDLAGVVTPADTPEALATLRDGLGAKSNAIVARAAELVGKRKAVQLIPDLCAAFSRFLGAGMASDKICLAKTAIVKALQELGSNQTEVFLTGMACYWPERPRPGQRDEAAPLRIASVTAHAQFGSSFDLEPLVDCLGDPVDNVRHRAAAALAAIGGQGIPLLRFKANVGDDNPSVMEECFNGLLRSDPNKYVPFVGRFLEDRDERIRVVAALALGQTGREKALELLISTWRMTPDRDLQRDLAVAIALMRKDSGLRFLLSLVQGDASIAEDALAALATYRSDPQIRQAVLETVRQTDNPEILRLFEQYFGRQPPNTGGPS